jgi:hypothetical protein
MPVPPHRLSFPFCHPLGKISHPGEKLNKVGARVSGSDNAFYETVDVNYRWFIL